MVDGALVRSEFLVQMERISENAAILVDLSNLKQRTDCPMQKYLKISIYRTILQALGSTLKTTKFFSESLFVSNFKNISTDWYWNSTKKYSHLQCRLLPLDVFSLLQAQGVFLDQVSIYILGDVSLRSRSLGLGGDFAGETSHNWESGIALTEDSADHFSFYS